MRRYAFIILFALVLVAPLVARLAMAPPQSRSSAGDGSLRLVVITPHNQDIRHEFARAFDRWHVEHYGQSVTLDYRTPGGTNDIERQLKSIFEPYRDAAGKIPASVSTDIDVVWGGGDFSFNQVLKPAGVLQPAPISPALLSAAFPDPTLAGVRLYDATTSDAGRPTPLWIGVCLSSFGIMYNPQLFATLQLPAPRSWDDLTHQRLSGFITLADPAHSGSAAVAYMMVLQRGMADAETEFFQLHPSAKGWSKAQRAGNDDYQRAISAGWKRGMGRLVLIAANARYFTDSSEQVPNDVARGDAAAGMAIDFYARVTEQVVGSARAQFVLPAGATAITPDPVAILVGVRGARLTLATHFIEYLLSPEGQRLWILKAGTPGGPLRRGLWRMPIRRDVYLDRANWEATIDPFEESHGFNERGEWMANFGDTRMLWDAAWIDSRDALISAYSAVLRVSDAAQRAQLIGALQELPIEMGVLQSIANQRKQVSADDLDVWNAELRINWGKRFRAHYHAVEMTAWNRADLGDRRSPIENQCQLLN